MNGSPAAFCDRAGTLLEEVEDCADPARVRVYPGVPAALEHLKSAGFRVFLITNQAGIGRGYFTLEQYRAVEREFLRQVGPARIDASYFCPDAPGVPSLRRKPEPGMVLEAAAEYGIDLETSWFVGDKAIDIECGRRAGTRTILVLTGYGKSQDCRPDFHAETAAEAVSLILRHSPLQSTRDST